MRSIAASVEAAMRLLVGEGTDLMSSISGLGNPVASTDVTAYENSTALDAPLGDAALGHGAADAYAGLADGEPRGGVLGIAPAGAVEAASGSDPAAAFFASCRAILTGLTRSSDERLFMEQLIARAENAQALAAAGKPSEAIAEWQAVFESLEAARVYVDMTREGDDRTLAQSIIGATRGFAESTVATLAQSVAASNLAAAAAAAAAPEAAPPPPADVPVEAAVAVETGPRIDTGIVYDAEHALMLDVYRPAGEGNTPVMLYLHAGAWCAGQRDGGDALVMAEHMLADGVAVVAIDYRLCGNGVEFPTPLLDITTALQWVQDHATEYGFDLDHVMLGGSSAGGHLALQYALNGEAYGYGETLPRIDQVLAVSPCTDLTVDFWNDGYAFNDEIANLALQAVAHNDREILADSSPINHIADGASVDTRFIVMAGTEDDVCTFNEQYVPFVQRMEQAGYDVSGLVSQGGAHGDYLYYIDDPDYVNGAFWDRLRELIATPTRGDG